MDVLKGNDNTLIVDFLSEVHGIGASAQCAKGCNYIAVESMHSAVKMIELFKGEPYSMTYDPRAKVYNFTVVKC